MAILHGVIDPAFRQANGGVLVDYKTDRVEMVDLGCRYAAQVDSYAARWTQVAGVNASHAGLFSVCLGELSRSLYPRLGPQE